MNTSSELSTHASQTQGERERAKTGQEGESQSERKSEIESERASGRERIYKRLFGRHRAKCVNLFIHVHMVTWS